ncbi:MAG: TonB family protein, partial [Woeseia sp.]
LADSGRRIAPVIGPDPAAGNAAPAGDIPNPMALDAGDSGGIMSGKMPLFAGAGVAAVLAIIGIWSLFGGSTEVPTDRTTPTGTPAVAETAKTAGDAAGDNDSNVAGEPERRPAVTESDVPAMLREPAATPAEAAPAWAGMLEDARLARDAGQIIAPPGNNAVERYIAARDAFPDNETIASELALLMDEVYGMAETALLDNRTADAAAALKSVALADAGSPRLAFLNAQLAQMQLRSALDGARNAIREGRFEDAGRLLNRAQAYAGTNTAEVSQLAEDLAQARSAQQVDEVLAMASERLAADQLTAPSNDNARYYFELALTNDPDNKAAQQGLNAIASRLVLRARAAIDAGSLDDAQALLDDARALDPASADLEASVAALEAARERIAADERQAAAERAEAARQAAAAREEAARQAEAERLADLEQQQDEAAAATVAGDTIAETDASDASSPVTEEGALEDSSPSASSAAGGPGSLPFDGPVDGLADNAIAGGSAKTGGTSSTDNDGSLASDAPAAGASDTSGSEDEIVAISRLTRVNYVAPKYPRSAARRNISGWVDIAFTVSPQGSVTNIDITESAPGSIFDDAAREAVAE